MLKIFFNVTKVETECKIPPIITMATFYYLLVRLPIIFSPMPFVCPRTRRFAITPLFGLYWFLLYTCSVFSFSLLALCIKRWLYDDLPNKKMPNKNTRNEEMPKNQIT
jgi:hypothetical protein